MRQKPDGLWLPRSRDRYLFAVNEVCNARTRGQPTLRMGEGSVQRSSPMVAVYKSAAAAKAARRLPVVGTGSWPRAYGCDVARKQPVDQSSLGMVVLPLKEGEDSREVHC